MGGLAGEAGKSELTEPRWLVGGEAVLSATIDGPVVWLVSIDDPLASTRAEQVSLLATAFAEVARYPDAGERLVRRRLAMLLLAGASGCRPDEVAIAHDAAGAPRVAMPMGWHLSVAARWPDCAIGVARAPLGVDIERITDEPIATDLLTPAERTSLEALPAADRASAFAACWAAKEAHAKSTGRPRDLDPAQIDTSGSLVTSPLGQTRCWRRIDGALAVAFCTAA